MNFELLQEVRVLSGAGRVADVGALLEELGSPKTLVVTDRGLIDAGVATRVTDSLDAAGIAWALFDRVQADPPAHIIEEGYAFYCANQCGAVVAVGGGSAIDTAKGINVLAYNEGPILAYRDFDRPMARTRNLIVVPTTSGTGSEMSDGLVVTAPDGSKTPILAVNGMANYAVLDPELTLALPAGLTAATGMDAFAHVAEAYTSKAAAPLTDVVCLGAMETVHAWLPKAVANGSSMEARAMMQSVSTIGGWMLRYGHTHAGHSMAHVLGARLHLPHGLACALALPYVLEYNAPALPQKTRVIGRLLGADIAEDAAPEVIGQKTRDALMAFVHDTLGLPRAKEFAPAKADYAGLAKEIAAEMFQVFNPRTMTAADAETVLEKLFA